MIKLKEGDPSSACKVTTPVAGFGSVNLPLMVLKLCAQMIHGSGLKGYHFFSTVCTGDARIWYLVSKSFCCSNCVHR
jgi:hypothetical protein